MPPTTRSQRRKPVRSLGSGQPRPSPSPRTMTTRHLAPPDYTSDYEDVRRDLRMIALLSVLLFVGMIGAALVL